MDERLKGRRVNLIGGAGFMGHHLALALKDRGAEVVIYDSLQVNNLLQFLGMEKDVPHRSMYIAMIRERLALLESEGISVQPVDARDYAILGRAVASGPRDVIIHLAAVAHAGKSNKDPLSTFDHSLRTLENALDCARDTCSHFIYISSSMVYGNFLTPSVTEDHPLEPLGIYGALKLAGEKLVIAYNQVFDLPYTIIRPSALYGPRCVSRRVSQIFIENALLGEPLQVQGGGEERLDFTYIDDLVEGICAMVLNPSAMNDVFNLTYGQARSIDELLEIVQKEIPDVEVNYTERDKLQPSRGTLIVDKAREAFGYNPTHSIEAGVPKYIEWYREFFKKHPPA